MALFSSKSSDDTPARRDRLASLCGVVSRGLTDFAIVGDALAEIRDSQLYLLEAGTFDAFCRDRWDMTAQHAGRLMEAASVCRQLAATGSTPSSIRQASAIASLPEPLRMETWEEAQASADASGKVPAKAVHAAVAKRTKRARSKVDGTLRKISIRVPGGRVVIEPNSKAKGKTHADLLRFALEQLATVTSKAA